MDEHLLANMGLDDAHLDKIREMLPSKSLGLILDLGEIAVKYLHPERLSAEFQVHDALETLSRRSMEIMDKQRQLLEKTSEGERTDKKEMLDQYNKDLLKVNTEMRDVQQKHLESFSQLTADLRQVREKLLGPGIGTPGELVTIKDLKSAFPADHFSHTNAAAGGADIVAEVRDGQAVAGKVVVSVKYASKWQDDFVTQLKKNLQQEKTEFGILVSKVFPSDALNEKAYLTDEGWAVVRPEYAVIAYMGMRESVIHLHRAMAPIRAEEDRMRTRERVTSALRDWLTGENFRKAAADLDLAVQASKESDVIVQQWQNYADEKSTKVQKLQQQLRAYLIACSSLLTDLQSKLGRTDSESLPPAPIRPSEVGA